MRTASKTRATPTRTIRVVVADDSEVFRRALREFLDLTLEMVVVAEAPTGEAAIPAVTRTAPDLVLMDVRMPGIGGLEATRLMKRAPGCPRVVLLTLNDSPDLQNAAASVGADGFLGKGRIPDLLPELMRKLFAVDEENDRDR